jgi:hypothetical protein
MLSVEPTDTVFARGRGDAARRKSSIGRSYGRRR